MRPPVPKENMNSFMVFQQNILLVIKCFLQKDNHEKDNLLDVNVFW